MNDTGSPAPAGRAGYRNWLLPIAALALAAALKYTEMMTPIDNGMPRVMVEWIPAFSRNIRVGGVEIVVLYAILRPWSYRQSVEPAVCAWAVFTPWTLVYTGISIPQGPVATVHVEWQMAVCTALFLTACVSTVSRRRMKSRLAGGSVSVSPVTE